MTEVKPSGVVNVAAGKESVAGIEVLADSPFQNVISPGLTRCINPDPAAAITGIFAALGFPATRVRARSDCELDESFKQFCTYCVVSHHPINLTEDWEPRQIKVLVYERGKQPGDEMEGDARLRGKLSIGVGGHVNAFDLGQGAKRYHLGRDLGRRGLLETYPTEDDQYMRARTLSEAVQSATSRELDEELICSGLHARGGDASRLHISMDMRHLGLIYDDSNPVGRVHLGFVSECRFYESGLLEKLLRGSQLGGATMMSLSQIIELNQTQPEAFESWSQILIRSVAETVR